MKAVSKDVVVGEKRDARFAHIQPLYRATMSLVERLHRQLLNVIAAELERAGRSDISSLEAFLLHSIGRSPGPVEDFCAVGFYHKSELNRLIGSLEKRGFLDKRQSRSASLVLSIKGEGVQRIIGALFARHSQVLHTRISAEDLAVSKSTLLRLNKYWIRDFSSKPLPIKAKRISREEKPAAETKNSSDELESVAPVPASERKITPGLRLMIGDRLGLSFGDVARGEYDAAFVTVDVDALYAMSSSERRLERYRIISLSEKINALREPLTCKSPTALVAPEPAAESTAIERHSVEPTDLPREASLAGKLTYALIGAGFAILIFAASRIFGLL